MFKIPQSLAILMLLALVASCGPKETRQATQATSVMKYSELGPPPGQPSQLQIQASAARRMVIKDADLSIEVSEYDQAFADVQKVAAQYSGYLVSSSTNSFENGKKSGDMTVRVPSESFDSVLQQLKSLGQKVEGETIRGTDVTEEFYDVSARLQNSTKTEQRLLEILKSAKSVKDILEVEKVIASTREEIERLEARKRFLSNQVTLSTIKVHLHEAGATSSSEQQGFWELIKDGFRTGWSALVGFFRILVIVLMVGIPAAIVILAIALVAWRIAVRIRARFSKSE